MAGQGQYVETTAMHASIQAFENTAQDLMNAMRQLKQFLDQDASAQIYQGQQANAFNQVRTQVEADLNLAGQKLSDMAAKMKDVFGNYSHNDGEAAAEFQKLTDISNSAGSLNPGVSGLLPAPSGSSAVA